MSASPNNPQNPRTPRARWVEAVFAVMFSTIVGFCAGITHRVAMDVRLYEALETGVVAGCGTIAIAFVILTYVWNGR
ncbi:hypothetical protein ACF1G5_26520 [Streptomyces coeruleorubidus]|jgi:hypothetical protein|uniref:hypothetical protein n=1 Tax=Streptomyces coeruleorubidus TaxID=116188 RepID=UPI0036FBE12A